MKIKYDMKEPIEKKENVRNEVHSWTQWCSCKFDKNILRFSESQMETDSHSCEMDGNPYYLLEPETN